MKKQNFLTKEDMINYLTDFVLTKISKNDNKLKEAIFDYLKGKFTETQLIKLYYDLKRSEYKEEMLKFFLFDVIDFYLAKAGYQTKIKNILSFDELSWDTGEVKDGLVFALQTKPIKVEHFETFPQSSTMVKCPLCFYQTSLSKWKLFLTKEIDNKKEKTFITKTRCPICNHLIILENKIEYITSHWENELLNYFKTKTQPYPELIKCSNCNSWLNTLDDIEINYKIELNKTYKDGLIEIKSLFTINILSAKCLKCNHVWNLNYSEKINCDFEYLDEHIFAKTINLLFEITKKGLY